MAENLNYNASGSVCYDGDDSYCKEYGRLYDWATAMDIDSSCNSKLCADSIEKVNHKGICPEGWHIPSVIDFLELLKRVVSDLTIIGGPGLYENTTAGKYLKATKGWTNCGSFGSGSYYLCEDTYGFSALPGGLGAANYGYYVYSAEKTLGYWRIANENENDEHKAYSVYMWNDEMYTMLSNPYPKVNMYSIRCLKNPEPD